MAAHECKASQGAGVSAREPYTGPCARADLAPDDGPKQVEHEVGLLRVRVVQLHESHQRPKVPRTHGVDVGHVGRVGCLHDAAEHLSVAAARCARVWLAGGHASQSSTGGPHAPRASLRGGRAPAAAGRSSQMSGAGRRRPAAPPRAAACGRGSRARAPAASRRRRRSGAPPPWRSWQTTTPRR